MGRQLWVMQKPEDDVATALVTLTKDTEVNDADKGIHITLLQTIPFGHKFALRDVPAGAHVHKYGQVIGAASVDIRVGDHVHTHNLESLRGRGDLVKERV